MREQVGKMARLPCTECSVTLALLALYESMCAEETHGECRFELKGKPRLALTMPVLIFPQSPFTLVCHALTMFFLLHHAPALSGYDSHLCDNPQLRRADATIPHEKLPVLRDPVIQICKTSSSVILIGFSL